MHHQSLDAGCNWNDARQLALPKLAKVYDITYVVTLNFSFTKQYTVKPIDLVRQISENGEWLLVNGKICG